MSASEYLGDPNSSDDPQKWRPTNPGVPRHMPRESSIFPNRHRQVPSYVPPFYHHGRADSVADTQAQHHRTQSASDLSFLQSPHQSPYLGSQEDLQQFETHIDLQPKQQSHQKHQQVYSGGHNMASLTSGAAGQGTDIFPSNHQGLTSSASPNSHKIKGSISKLPTKLVGSKPTSRWKNQVIFDTGMPNLTPDNQLTDASSSQLLTQPTTTLPPLTGSHDFPARVQQVHGAIPYDGLRDTSAGKTPASNPSQFESPTGRSKLEKTDSSTSVGGPGPMVWHPPRIFDSQHPQKVSQKKRKRKSNRNEQQSFLVQPNPMITKQQQQQQGMGLGIDIQPSQAPSTSNWYASELGNTPRQISRIPDTVPQRHSSSYDYTPSPGMIHTAQRPFDLRLNEPRTSLAKSSGSGGSSAMGNSEIDQQRGSGVAPFPTGYTPSIMQISAPLADENIQNVQLSNVGSERSLVPESQQIGLTPQMLAGWSPQVGGQYAFPRAPRQPYVPYSQIAQMEQQQQEIDLEKSQFKRQPQNRDITSHQQQHQSILDSESPQLQQDHHRNQPGLQSLTTGPRKLPQHIAEGIGLTNPAGEWTQESPRLSQQKAFFSPHHVAGPSNAPVHQSRPIFQYYHSALPPNAGPSGTIPQHHIPNLPPQPFAGESSAPFVDLRTAQDDDIMAVPSDNYSEAALDFQWSDESVHELMKLLEPSERYKWKYLSELLSSRQNKRIPLRACKQKFESLFGEAEASSLLRSSLFYVAYRSGWDTIKNIRTVEEIDDSGGTKEDDTVYGSLEGKFDSPGAIGSDHKGGGKHVLHMSGEGISATQIGLSYNAQPAISDTPELLKASMVQYEAQQPESIHAEVMRQEAAEKSDDSDRRSTTPQATKATTVPSENETSPTKSHYSPSIPSAGSSGTQRTSKTHEQTLDSQELRSSNPTNVADLHPTTIESDVSLGAENSPE